MNRFIICMNNICNRISMGIDYIIHRENYDIKNKVIYDMNLSSSCNKKLQKKGK